jgi:hypothetical protein
VRDAFNEHQRRRGPTGERLLGPDAVAAAVKRFEALGYDVRTRSTPWRLGAADAGLLAEWFQGWVGAALEQRPELAVDLGDYLPSRRTALAQGRLRVTVGHTDLLALR